MNYKEVLKKVGAALLALTFWEIAALLIHQRILLVTPVAVARRLCTIWRVEGFARAIWFSFYHIAGGFLLGLILGCLLAYLAAKHPVVETLLWPWMATIKSVPVASFVVICLIWLSARNLSVFISDRNSDHISECLRGTTCRKPGDAGGRNSLSAAMAQTLPLYRAAEASSVSSFCLPCDNRYGMEGRYRRRDHRRAERFDRQDALYSKNIP